MQRKIGLPNLFDQKIQGRERKTATQPKMTKNIKRKDSTDKKPLLVSDEPGPVQQTVVSAQGVKRFSDMINFKINIPEIMEHLE